LTSSTKGAKLLSEYFVGYAVDQNEPEITVDNIEVAQFIHLLLNNQKIRDVINTITSKAVLILGRFTDERKAVLDALREELRKRNLLPILFDFAIPASRDVTETIKTLAGCDCRRNGRNGSSRGAPQYRSRFSVSTYPADPAARTS
jgi:hypothetical protein